MLKDNRIKDCNLNLIDEAWDSFSELIGKYELKTPLTLKQFNDLFNEINKNGEFEKFKADILRSFRYDSYMWPLVQRKN